jgi:hypothetical protein
LIRGADKKIRRVDNKSAYELAIESNQNEIAKVLEPKNLCRKYFCMETELGPFKAVRNDLFLLISLIVVIVLKILYVLKINEMIYTTKDFENSTNFPTLPFWDSYEYNSNVTMFENISTYVDCTFGNYYFLSLLI